MMETVFPLTAKTLPGLEGVLAAEIEALGGAKIEKGALAVTFMGGPELLYRAVFCLRTALRVLVPVRKFSAERTDHIYAAARDFPWEDYTGPDTGFAVDAVLASRTFTNTNYCALKVKDAIADRFSAIFGRRPSVDTESPGLRVNLFIHGEDCTLSIDASGASLHRRGYRLEKTDAPLNEVLAAGITLLSGWDGAAPFHDPMCGSGTFLAEAGLIAARRPPGFLKERFGFMGWKNFDAGLWEKVKAGALAGERKMTAQISGADSDASALEVCAANLRRAGLENSISLARAVFGDSHPPPGPGTLIMNPPYGKRMDGGDISGLYANIGDVLKRNYTGWTAWIFSANLQAIKHIGLRPFCRIPLKNGPLDCRLLGFKLF
jgi:putative N6-adenine-specific DNA methylase